MSVKKFKFVSPGVFLNEIDQSQLPKAETAVGPVIIGRTQRGPAYRPTKVESFSDFIEVFGEPAPGASPAGDQWRYGIPQGPTYASYAAQAYLRNNGPVTMVRILGDHHDNKTSADTATAGYRVGAAGADAGDSNGAGGAYGLFVFPSSSVAFKNAGATTAGVTGTLGAVFYLTGGTVGVTGSVRRLDNNQADPVGIQTGVSGTRVVVANDGGGGIGGSFSVLVKTEAEAKDSTTGPGSKFNFNFSPDSDKFIRRVFNTDATRLNTNITTTDAQQNYFLGQSYERSVQSMLDKDAGGTSNNMFAVMLPLRTSAISAANYRMKAREAQSGWVISQDLRNTQGDTENFANNAQSFDPEGSDVTRLFKFKGLSEGEWIQRNLKISIERIKVSPDNFNKYGSFSVVIRKIEDNDQAIKVVERFDNLNLNPYSPDYVAKRIGDMYEVFDHNRRRLQSYGRYPNNSKFIRMEMNNMIDSGQGSPELLPFGFFGPVIYNHFSITSDGGEGTHYDIAGSEATVSGSTILNAFDTAHEAFGTGSAANGIGKIFARPSGDIKKFAEITITIGGAITEDQTIVLTSQDATVKTYTAKAAESASSKQFVVGGTAAETATSLAVCINHANGHNGKLVATASSNVVTVKNAVAGGDGNRAVTNNLSNVTVLGKDGVTPNRFTGGDQDQIGIDVKIEFPSHRLVGDSSEFGLSDHRMVYFGVDTTKSGSSNLAFDPSNIDLAHPLAAGIADSMTPTATTTTSYVFTLDDISGSSNSTLSTDAKYNRFYYVSGSRASGKSITAATGSYKAVLKAFRDVGGAKFTMPLFGGFNGFDIREKEPLNHYSQLAPAAAEQSHYGYYSVKKAMDIVADPEYVEMNLVSAPGIVNNNLTAHLINICEERADSLAIIDPLGGYTPSTDASTSEQVRTKADAVQDVLEGTGGFVARNINSSYAAAYFPWVQIRDSIKGNLVYVPPSVVALGVLGASEAKSAVWFAPAGFNRGGLNENGAGLAVTGVRHKLTSGERDRLYEANINPIASFPSEGIVVFGQKTLQVTPSALDRINVRRLMIFIKRGMSRIANTTLFDQNLPATWTRFKTRADNFLGNVKAGLGLQDFKVVLDETTTTADLVDRNIMYAKIFIKPAKAIEFIALDFVITRSGASFDD